MPSPAEPSPGHLPGSWPGLRPQNPGPSSWTPKPCSRWKETQAGGHGTSQFEGDCPGGPCEPSQGGSENQEVEEGAGQVGGWLGQLGALGPGVRTVGRKSAGTGRGGEPQFVATGKGREPSTAFLGKGLVPPCLLHLCLLPTIQQPAHHRTPWPSPEPRRPRYRTSPATGLVRGMSWIRCPITNQLPPCCPPALWGLNQGFRVKGGCRDCLLPTYCVPGWGNSGENRQVLSEDLGEGGNWDTPTLCGHLALAAALSVLMGNSQGPIGCRCEA